MSTSEILTGTLANNIFQAIWLCCIVPEPKHNWKKTVLIVIGTTILYTWVAMTICMTAFQWLSAPVGVFLGYLAGVLLYGIMYCFLVSASHPVKSLFLFTGYFSVHTSIVIIVYIVTDTYVLGNQLVWALRAVLNLAVLIPYLFFFREHLFRMYKEIKSSYGKLSTVFIMCYFVQLLFWVYDMEEQKRSPFDKVLLIYVCALTVTVYIMIFRHMAQSDHTSRMRQLQANEKFLQTQIDSYKKMGENARQTRHDFRHHILVVAEYAKNKDYKAILSYLSEYEEKEQGKYQDAFCKNRAADTVLYAYASKCEQNDIEYSADVWLKENEGVSDYDLVAILANILENAVNGCMEVEGKRNVKISIGPKENKLVIVCINTCVSDILFENDLPKNREREGIGVESILSAAAKYGGVVDFSASDGVFVCQVILNNVKQKN